MSLAQYFQYHILPVRARVAVMYFTAKSRWPNSTKICRICLLCHLPVPNSAKFRENIEIPRKWTNSAARLKIPSSVENCGPYCSLYDNTMYINVHCTM